MLSRAGPTRGMSMIEVIVVLALVATLASLALPSFERQLQQARRSDAWVSTQQVQVAQEHHRSHATAYGGLAEIGIAPLSAGGHYVLEILSHDEDGFTLLASATGPQARDTDCRHLLLQWRQLTPVYASGPDRGVGNGPDTNRRCWRQA